MTGQHIAVRIGDTPILYINVTGWSEDQTDDLLATIREKPTEFSLPVTAEAAPFTRFDQMEQEQT